MLALRLYSRKDTLQFIVLLSHPLPTQPYQIYSLCTHWPFWFSPTNISIPTDLCNSTPDSLNDRWAQTNLSPCLGSSSNIGGPHTEVSQVKFSPFTDCVMTLVWFIHLFETQFLIRIIICVWSETTCYLSSIFIPSCLVREHDFFIGNSNDCS